MPEQLIVQVTPCNTNQKLRAGPIPVRLSKKNCNRTVRPRLRLQFAFFFADWLFSTPHIFFPPPPPPPISFLRAPLKLQHMLTACEKAQNEAPCISDPWNGWCCTLPVVMFSRPFRCILRNHASEGRMIPRAQITHCFFVVVIIVCNYKRRVIIIV